jgi:homopolymeric O-antigen transport system ATP-binding protein
MSNAIIKIENLSKKYIIGHDRRATGMYNYNSLRDSLAHFSRGVYQRLRHPLSPNQENTELEEFWALKDINFEVKQGERVGVIGRNGAGKSTLLKILSRITEPTSGKITMRGRVASLLEVGTGFHPELTGRENIYLNGAILGMTRIEIKKKFDEIVAFAEVEKFLDTPVKRYSSGMYVRLAFAVAAHLEPEILLVDEVLAVGDAEFQKKCLGKMEDVSNEGRTVIFVSHNMAAIKQLCNKGILLEAGESSYKGNVEICIDKYIQQLTSNLNVKHVASTEGKKSAFICLIQANVYAKKINNDIITNGDDLVFRAEIKVDKACDISICIPVRRDGELCFLANSYHLANRFIIKEKGIYQIECNIPSKLLNPGFHSLGLYIADSYGREKHYVRIEELLGFDIFDDGVRRGGLYSGSWGGAVSPLLNFDLKKIHK